MNILGIETSCDETAASVVKDGKFVLSNVVASSLKQHIKYGGVIPEIASRHHLESINAVVESAIAESNISFKKIDAIAVTESPGLIGSLLVGFSFAKALSYVLKKPLIPVNHIKAHLYSSFLVPKDRKKTSLPKPELPAIGLVVSGGHTSLYLIKDFTKYKLLGYTLDDAAGEAFDKTARILGLGYPGGPAIDKTAKKAGNNNKIQFKSAQLPGSFNFSFSGVKTAVLYYHQKYNNDTAYSKAKVAHAFQKSVVSALVEKSIAACKKNRIKNLIIGGGVAANSSLRENLSLKAQKNDINVFFPALSLCVDNAAMIAGLGYHTLKKSLKR